MSFLSTVSFQAAGLSLAMSFVLHKEHQTGYRVSVKLMAVCFGEICLRVKGQMQMEPLSGPTGHVLPVCRVEEQMR